MAKASKKKTSSGNKAGIGLGIAAAAAAIAAGSYFLYGKDGAKNRKKVKGWMLKAKGEVLEKIEKMKDITEEDYHKVLEGVSKKYTAMKNVDSQEVEALVSDLKKHWKNIHGSVAPKPKKKTVKKAVKKAKKKA